MKKRLMKEIEMLQIEPPPGITAWCCDESMSHLEARKTTKCVCLIFTFKNSIILHRTRYFKKYKVHMNLLMPEAHFHLSYLSLKGTCSSKS